MCWWCYTLINLPFKQVLLFLLSHPKFLEYQVDLVHHADLVHQVDLMHQVDLLRQLVQDTRLSLVHLFLHPSHPFLLSDPLLQVIQLHPVVQENPDHRLVLLYLVLLCCPSGHHVFRAVTEILICQILKSIKHAV